jgi:hypothetical protein
MAPSSTSPTSITPGAARVGGVGGVEGGMNGPTGLFANPIPEGEGGGVGAPPPSLEDWRAAREGGGGTVDQYLAETGQQNVRDQIGSTPGLKIGEGGDLSGVGGYKGRLTPGGYEEVKPPPGQPNNATLQDYLAQGKTAQEWYAETGRQSELDSLTGGATREAPTDVKSAWNQGIAPSMGEGGKYTIPAAPVPSTTPRTVALEGNQPSSLRPELIMSKASEITGRSLSPEPAGAFNPIAEGNALRSQLSPEDTGPIPTVPTNAPTPTPANELQKKINEAKTDQEVQQAIDEYLAKTKTSNKFAPMNQGGFLPNPTPTPAPARR